VAYAGARFGAVFTDTRCKYDSIKSVHSRRIRAYVFLNLISEYLDGKLCACVAFLDSRLKVSAVGGYARYAEEAALLIHEVTHFIGSEALVFHDIRNNGRVNRAATRAHFNAVKRREAHACIHTSAALYGGDGRTVAYMAGDNLCLFRGLAENFYHLAGNIAMRCSVRTVAADMLLFHHFIRNGVNICLFGHGLMESRIKYEHLRNIRHNLCTAFDSHEVRSCMKRREIAAELQLCKHFFGDKNTLEEVRTSVHYSVTYSLDLAHIPETAYLGIGERVDNESCGNGMIGNSFSSFLPSAVL